MIEMNASDNRNKAAIEHSVKELSDNKSIDYFSLAGRRKQSENRNPVAVAQGGGSTKKSVIIMDEVDGLGVGMGDRGGLQAMIGVVKNT